MIGVLGSINLDLVVRAAHLPRPGETVVGDQVNRFPGGKGANQALAAHRAGSGLRFFGAAGADDFATLALAELRAEGVDLTHIKIATESTGIAIILVDHAGENVITVVPGANASIDLTQAQALLSALNPGDTVLLQQEIPAQTVRHVLQGARKKRLRSILNIAPIIAETGQLADLADIVIANETELAALLGINALNDEDLHHAALSRAKTHNQTIVLTLGAKGALATTAAGELFDAPSLSIEPVDTVGAGDTFCGYLAAGLDQGLPPATGAHARRRSRQPCLPHPRCPASHSARQRR